MQLSAAPSLNSTFAGWTGGGCTGTSTCLVTMNAAQSVTATFSPGATGAVNWSKVVTTSSPDSGYTVAFDSQGNVFVAGTFQGAHDFGAGLVTSVGVDMFVAKYSSSGAYQWARHFNGGSVLPLGIATDANGDVYVTGRFTGTTTLGNGPLTCAGNAGYNQGFVAKYIGSGPNQGTFGWQHCMGANRCHDLCERAHGQASGDVLVTGEIGNTGVVSDFGGMTLDGSAGVFVARYATSDGTLKSLKKPGTSPGGGCHAYTIAVDGSGNIVLGGSFIYNVNFGNGSVPSIGSSEDAFIAKVKPDGSYIWFKTFGDGQYDSVFSVAVDGAGNVGYSGVFHGQIDIGTVETSLGLQDIVVGKCAAANGAYTWGRRFGGPGDDAANSIAMNDAGDVVFTGSISSSVDFGGGPLGAFGITDIFVAKFFANKSYAWSNSWGSSGSDSGNGIAMHSSGAIAVTGNLSGAIDFGDVAPRYGGGGDAFLLKLTP